MKDEGFVPKVFSCHSDQREESPTRIAQLVRTRNGSEGGRSCTERRFGGTSHPRVICGVRLCGASPGGRFLPLVGMTRELDGDCQPHIRVGTFGAKPRLVIPRYA